MSQTDSQTNSDPTAVGHGSPPKHTQFPKGMSGNRKGRPKGTKNLATLIRKAAYDQIEITTRTGEKKKLSRIAAATLQLANAAAKGETKSLLAFMDWVDEIEQRAEARAAEMSISEVDLQVLNSIYDRMQRCAAQSDGGGDVQPNQ